VARTDTRASNDLLADRYFWGPLGGGPGSAGPLKTEMKRREKISRNKKPVWVHSKHTKQHEINPNSKGRVKRKARDGKNNGQINKLQQELCFQNVLKSEAGAGRAKRGTRQKVDKKTRDKRTASIRAASTIDRNNSFMEKKPRRLNVEHTKGLHKDTNKRKGGHRSRGSGG